MAQFAGLLFLFFRVRVEKTILPFYIFYLVGMFVSLVSYCVLWIIYSSGDSYLDTFSYAAVIAILILLTPVAVMTYAIMWNPPETVTTELQVSDIRDFAGLCARIGEQSGKYASSPSAVIMKALPQSFQTRLTEIAESGKYTEKDTEDFVVELNKKLGNRDFFRKANCEDVNGADHITSHLRDGDELNTREVHELHRGLLSAAFPTKFHKRSRPGRPQVAFEGLLWHLKQGARKIPFWALTFFFTVFLVVTYLFGFAFAFHDRQVAKDGKPPALYMTKPQLAPLSVEKREDQPVPEHEHKFYFDKPSAIPRDRDSIFDETQYAPDYSADRIKDWGEKKNSEHLAELTEAILEASQEDTKVRLEVRGMADDGFLVLGGPYSSNYELSEARAHVLRDMVIKRLSKQYKWQPDIEWTILPLSSESLTEDHTRNSATPPVETKEQVQIRMQKLVDDGYLDQKEKSKLDFRLNYVQSLVKAKALTPESGQLIVKQTNELLTEMKSAKELQKSVTQPNLQPEEILRLQRELEAKRKLIKYAEEENQEAAYLDAQAKKRTVVVLVKSSKNNFYALSLMDHVYFTIYTITTTGYGDIIPTTTYAKFLCSFANILEVFFLVVFFNALMSVKEDNKDRRVRSLV
jgi:hypothetical protein